MVKYSHAYDFSFEVLSNDPEAEDVTPAMLRDALLARVNRLTDDELMEDCGRYDTMDVDG